MDKQDRLLALFESGKYYCKKDGTVWSRAPKNGRGPLLHNNKARKLKSIVQRYGKVILSGNQVLVHRAVWLYFNGRIPKDMQINHKNGDKTDNRVVNLEVVTCSENAKHAIKTGLRVIKKGSDCSYSKLTEEDVLKIRKDTRIHRVIAKEYGVTKNHIGDIKRHRRWKHI